MSESYPTRNGIAVPPQELWLPRSRFGDKRKYKNNHHRHFTERKYERTIATLALRNLERHQHLLPVDVHRYIHDTYGPPEMASERQAGLEVIDAYDQGESFKIYDHYSKSYGYYPIPLDLVDGFVAAHSLKRTFDMAAA